MKQNTLLTIASLLSILLFLVHLTDDIIRGIEPGGLENIIGGTLIMLVWLCGTLLLAGRRSGYVIMLLGGILAAVIPVLHMNGAGVGGDFAKSGRGTERPRHDSGETARLYVSLGRKDGIRPADLVGAIANETNLSGREIGPIKLAERFAVVGVPEWAADDVIEALRRTTLKNQKATVRRYSD